MRAAVVTSFDRPPHYIEHREPTPTGEEIIVEVLASALHPRVRSAADGSHYTSTGDLPLVPGIDGVGRGPNGELRYFLLADTPHGAMAERVAVDPRRSIVLPEGSDPVRIAAAMNPAMSSWVALRRRIGFTPGPSVLVLGATGSAGRLAIQVARQLGASEVIAAGRDATRLAGLPALGADRTVSLAGQPEQVTAALGDAAADVDVVLDYCWGTVAQLAIPAVLMARADRSRPVTWVEIGSMAGLEISMQSQWLRAARVSFVGSGQGSVPTRDILAELTDLAAHVGQSELELAVQTVPLSDVEVSWTTAAGSLERIVLVP